jgi:hypothetical protein
VTRRYNARYECHRRVVITYAAVRMPYRTRAHAVRLSTRVRSDRDDAIRSDPTTRVNARNPTTLMHAVVLMRHVTFILQHVTCKRRLTFGRAHGGELATRSAVRGRCDARAASSRR